MMRAPHQLLRRSVGPTATLSLFVAEPNLPLQEFSCFADLCKARSLHLLCRARSLQSTLLCRALSSAQHASLQSTLLCSRSRFFAELQNAPEHSSLQSTLQSLSSAQHASLQSLCRALAEHASLQSTLLWHFFAEHASCRALQTAPCDVRLPNNFSAWACSKATALNVV